MSDYWLPRSWGRALPDEHVGLLLKARAGLARSGAAGGGVERDVEAARNGGARDEVEALVILRSLAHGQVSISLVRAVRRVLVLRRSRERPVRAAAVLVLAGADFVPILALHAAVLGHILVDMLQVDGLGPLLGRLLFHCRRYALGLLRPWHEHGVDLRLKAGC